LKRSPIDVIKRGLVNVLANWPLLLIRIAEGVVLLIVLVVSVVAMIVPVAISIGATKFDPREGDPQAVIREIVLGHWGIILFLIVAITLVIGVVMAIHGFVQGAAARVYLDGEHAAAATAEVVPRRSAFHAFAPDRWFAGGAQTWWPIFWIYNLAWGLATLIILLPFMAIALTAAVFVIRSGSFEVNPQAATVGTIVGGCALLLLFTFFTVVVCAITSVWTYKAIVIAVDERIGASAALGAAWRAFRLDAARNFVVLLILFAVAVGGGMFLASISTGFNYTHRLGNVAFMFLPAQIAVSLVQSVFSAFMDSWVTASFASLQGETKLKIEK
jgi:hypothetical protein